MMVSGQLHEARKARFTCPVCQNTYDVDLPFTSFNKAQEEKGLVTILLKATCGHTCFAFIDRNYKVRGAQCADYEIDSGNATAIPFANPQNPATDLLLKYTAEIIKADVKDEAFIKSIGAADKVDAIENALIHGDVKKAGSIIDNLRKFANEIDEKEFADRLLKKIKSLNKLIINNPNLDWDSLVLNDKEAKNETEFASFRAIHYDRIRKIAAELEFEAIEERLPRAAVDAKKQRLIELMDDA